MTTQKCRDCQQLVTQHFRNGDYSTCPKGHYRAHWYFTRQIKANRLPTRAIGARCPDFTPGGADERG